MTRLDLEKEILAIMGLLDTSGDVDSNIDTPTRFYVQGRIAQAVEDLVNEKKWSWRRDTFSVYLKAPLTGTLTYTKGQNTAVIVGQTPDATWYGCHILLGGGFPLTVKSFSLQTVTFEETISFASASGQAFTIYFDSACEPATCAIAARRTGRLMGTRFLEYLSRDQFHAYQGYLGPVGDYGRSIGSLLMNTVANPDVSQPRVYTNWRTLMISNVMRKIISFYPYPNTDYVFEWDGWRRAVPMSVDGADTGNADVPDFPEDLHRSLVLSKVKLLMGEYPGWELQASEKKTIENSLGKALENAYNADMRDQSEARPWRPSPMMVGR